MDHSRLRGGGRGRYHSRAVMPPPRPPPRPPPPAGASVGAPPASGLAPPALPPMVRFIVLAPPLPKISYMRSMPLWLDDIKPRYPGDHISTNACVQTPGIP